MSKSYLITNAPKKPRLTNRINIVKHYALIIKPTATVVVLGVSAAFLAEHLESKKYMS